MRDTGRVGKFLDGHSFRFRDMKRVLGFVVQDGEFVEGLIDNVYVVVDETNGGCIIGAGLIDDVHIAIETSSECIISGRTD